MTGTPQGGVISPLLATSTCTGSIGHGTCASTGCWSVSPMTCVVMCTYPASRPRPRWRGCGSPAGRTRVGTEGGQDPDRAPGRWVATGFDFLGFHHRLVRSDRRRPAARACMFLARWPSNKAMQHARDRIRELTARSPAAAAGRGDRGGGATGSYAAGPRTSATATPRATSTRSGIRADAVGAGSSPRRHKRPAGFGSVGGGLRSHRTTSGWSPLTGPSPHPGPSGPGGGDRMPAVNGVGEPCAGEPHARFDGRELETEQIGHGHGEERPAGNRAGHQRLRDLPPNTSPRQLPTLHVIDCRRVS